MKSHPEPYRVKSVEPIALPDRERREEVLRSAGLNLFKVPAEEVFVDLLTDSGTSAMSASQWAGLMDGDESYAGCRNFYNLEAAVHDITGMPHVIPTHQGRAAEHLLFSVMVKPGQHVPNNTHFDTTRANIEIIGAEAHDFPVPGAEADSVFHGDMDLGSLERILKEQPAERIPCVMLTLTNNSRGGLPVSLANVRAVSRMSRARGIPLILDASRYAENAFFIQRHEKGWREKSIRAIAAEIFACADGFTMSAKKDGLVNMGGLIGLRDGELAERVRSQLVLFEGFPTYGGLAGRDIEAMARGLLEALDECYLEARVGQVRRFGESLERAGVPIVTPIGGHAVYVDAKAFLGHLPREQFPGHALCVALYLEGGVRSCEIGGVMFGRENSQTGALEFPEKELLRLAVPRRAYTDNHLAYVAEVFETLAASRGGIRGVRIVKEPPMLRHFTAEFAYA
jgi:tryptophanase